jgi:hypothetical protein
MSCGPGQCAQGSQGRCGCTTCRQARPAVVVCAHTHKHPRTETPAVGSHAACAAALPSGSPPPRPPSQHNFGQLKICQPSQTRGTRENRLLAVCRNVRPVLKYLVPHGSQCVMGRLVHTGLGSSSLVAHVLHYPPPPHANSFVLGPVVINHTPSNPTNFGLVFRSPQTLRVFGELMSNISATRGRPDMRFCVCVSPRGDLSHIAGLTLGLSKSDFFGANRRAQDHT